MRPSLPEAKRRDALLTVEGRRQAEQTRVEWSHFLSSAELVVCSPLRRAIETALVLTQNATAPAIGSAAVRYVLDPDVSEMHMGSTSAEGHNCKDLEAHFAEDDIDLSGWEVGADPILVGLHN